MNDDKTISLEAHKQKKTQQNTLQSYHRELANLQSTAGAPERFLAAWKKGVELAGENYFKLKCPLEQAKEKWDLCPNYELIAKVIGKISHGQAAMLGLMHSFYDSEEGQKLLKEANVENFVDALRLLSEEAKEVIAKLWMNYQGW